MIYARLLPDGIVVQVLPDGSTRPMESKTDWARLAAMTEEEIEANALSDPDNPPLTDEELARMRPAPRAWEIARRLNLTPEQFADRFDIPLHLVHAWIVEHKAPDTTARALLRVIDKHPDAVLDALWGEDRERRAG